MDDASRARRHGPFQHRARALACALRQHDIQAAIAVTALVHALSGAFLLRAMDAPLAQRSVHEDAALTIVWVPRAAPVSIPSARPLREATPSAPRAPRAPTAAETSPPATPTAEATRAPSRISAVDSLATLPADAPPGRPPGHAEPVASAGYRGAAFRRPGPDPFARHGDLFRMQDSSLGGRLGRMTRRSDCAELRAMLRLRGHDIDSVVRTMIERGCS